MLTTCVYVYHSPRCIPQSTHDSTATSQSSVVLSSAETLSLGTEFQQSTATDTITAQKVSANVQQESKAQVSTEITTAHEKTTSESDNITSQTGLSTSAVVHNVTENSVREKSVETYVMQENTEIVLVSQGNHGDTDEVCIALRRGLVCGVQSSDAVGVL